MSAPKASRSATKPASRRTANAGPKPTYQVVEDFLHYQAKNGEEFVLDLDFPGDILHSVLERGDASERDQFMTVLSALGDDEVLDRFKRLGALEQVRLVTVFFKAFEDAAGSVLGESGSSSN